MGFLVLVVLVGIGISGPGTANAQTDEITLTVTFVGGGNSLDFGRLRNLESDGTPTTESATRQVRLLIQPASGNTKPYLVTQILSQDPTQENGIPLAANSILYRVEEEIGSGIVRVPEQTPLLFGEEEIYRSASTGDESQLLIVYDLISDPEQEAGSYSGLLDYRVSMI